MRNKITKSILALFLCLIYSFPICAQEIKIDEFKLINEVALFVEQNYKNYTTSEQLKNRALEYMLNNDDTDIDNVLEYMLSGLDEYTTYFTKEEYESFSGLVNASLCGIGVGVSKVRSGIAVTQVIRFSPADKAGIKKFDIITHVNDISIVGEDIDTASSKIKGEAGTEVKITVKRYGCENSLDFYIVRGNVESSPVYWEKVDNETAYLLIDTITLNADVFVKEALDQIDREGIKKIILDLRDNSGGYLETTVNICNFFMPEGPVGYVDYKDPAKLETFYSTNKNPKYHLAVLINSQTASGAEFLSGGIQDRKVGKLFGEESFGKGTVQTTHALMNGGAFKVTVAKYYTALKQDVAKNHIKPDVEVKNSYIKVKEENFAPMQYEGDFSLGKSGKGVLAIEERLSVLGYLDEADENFDEETMDAVRYFKIALSLDPTPLVDMDFLTCLGGIEYDEIYLTNDRQFDSAYEYLKGLK